MNDQPEFPPTPHKAWIFVKRDTNRDLTTNAINRSTKDKDGKDVTAYRDIFNPLKIPLLCSSVQAAYVSALRLLYYNDVFVVTASLFLSTRVHISALLHVSVGFSPRKTCIVI